MFGEGQECPNQAYVSSWKAFSLCTGKSILAEVFHNKHWITPEGTPLKVISLLKKIVADPTEIQKKKIWTEHNAA